MVKQHIAGSLINGGSEKVLKDTSSKIVKEVQLRCGGFVDAIRFKFASGTYSEWAGGSGGKECKFTLEDHDYITGVRTRAGSNIDAIRFECASGRISPWFGGKGGAEAGSKFEGHALDEIECHCSRFVDKLDLKFQKLITPKPALPIFTSEYNGGSGGHPFCDCISRKIKSICVRAGSCVDSIRLLSSEGNPAHGGTGGAEHTFTIDDDDEVTAVTVWSGSLIDAIQFDTRKGKTSGKYGGPGGVQHYIKPPDSSMGLVGVAGREGGLVDGLQFYFGETDVGVTYKVEDFETTGDIMHDSETTECKLLTEFCSQNKTDSNSPMTVKKDFQITDQNTFTITNSTTWQHAWNVNLAYEQGFGPIDMIGFGCKLNISGGYSGSYTKQSMSADAKTKSFTKTVSVNQQWDVAPFHELKVSVKMTRKSGQIPFKGKLVKRKGDHVIGNQIITGTVKVDMLVKFESCGQEEKLPQLAVTGATGGTR